MSRKVCLATFTIEKQFSLFNFAEILSCQWNFVYGIVLQYYWSVLGSLLYEGREFIGSLPRVSCPVASVNDNNIVKVNETGLENLHFGIREIEISTFLMYLKKIFRLIFWVWTIDTLDPHQKTWIFFKNACRGRRRDAIQYNTIPVLCMMEFWLKWFFFIFTKLKSFIK